MTLGTVAVLTRGPWTVTDKKSWTMKETDMKRIEKLPAGTSMADGAFVVPWILRDALACCGKREVTTSLPATLTKPRQVSWGKHRRLEAP